MILAFLTLWAPRVLVALVVVGLGFLVPDVPWPVALGLGAAFAAFVLLRVRGWVAGIPALLLGLLLVPVFALLGFDALWALRLPRLGPVESALLGLVLLAVGAFVYLRTWLVVPTVPIPGAALVSVELAVYLIVVPPAAFWALGELNAGPPREAEQELEAISQLELVVLGDEPLERPGPQERRGWNVVTWTADLDGDEPTWAGEAPPAAVSPRADRVVLLAVDGTSPGGATAGAADAPEAEPRRWLAALDRANLTGTPAYALLRAPAPERRAAWSDALNSADPAARPGGVYDLAGAGELKPDYIDVALQTAVQDPNSEQLLALAARYRPLLFFDGEESTPVPLNIDQLIKHRLIHQCPRDESVPELCPVLDASGVDNATDHFAFDPRKLAELPADDPTADPTVIYVNVTTAANEDADRSTIYLDYWWFLPDNPTGAAGGALCGAGFNVGGLTCLDHQSDWEGVTVIVDADAPPDAPPRAVAYATHKRVVRYSWPALRRLWADDGDFDHFARRFAGPRRPLLRPLVFVARGSHAAYPRSCREVADDRSCRNGGVPGIPKDGSETPHDGEQAWEGNVPGACRAICLEALPTHRSGTRAARWNAYRGLWGSSDCVFAVVCTRAEPPRSPSRQHRYAYPWCADWTFELDGERFVERRRACTAREPTPEELQRGRRLLALGDSFSSGEGAGDYAPSTDRDDNSCHRSRDAWPEQLARRLRLVALPSLACSGALIDDVTTGRSRGERERQISQISRIRGNPHRITLTIGGNDAGFAGVLERCVEGDCVRRYRDTLTKRIDALGPRLRAAYRSIKLAAPGAELLVSGYPRLFPIPEGPLPVGNCSAGREISAAEATFLNGLTEHLNATIADAASRAGAEYVDVLDAFAGRELRCEGPSYVNRLNLAPRRFTASFHPKDTGYARLADVIAARLAERRLAPDTTDG